MTKNPKPKTSQATAGATKEASGSRFDLTTSSGLAAAAALLAGGSVSATAIAPIAVVAGPLAMFALYLARRVTPVLETQRESAAKRSVGAEPATAAKEQAEVVASILEAGKKQGLAEVEIVLDSDVGLDIGARLPKALNVDVRLKVGRNNKTIVRAKYKDS